MADGDGAQGVAGTDPVGGGLAAARGRGTSGGCRGGTPAHRDPLAGVDELVRAQPVGLEQRGERGAVARGDGAEGVAGAHDVHRAGLRPGGRRGARLRGRGAGDAEPGAGDDEGAVTDVVACGDRAHRGEYADLSGPILLERLSGLGAEISHTEILPDGIEPLASRLRDLSTQSFQLVLCTGGTGLGPRDLTLEALQTLDARHVPGLGEMFRSESRHHTSLAWLSRAEAVLLNDMLVIALPGSPKAVAQGMDILGPILAHAMAMVAGEAHA